jgi:hypothetical protein
MGEIKNDRNGDGESPMSVMIGLAVRDRLTM